MEEECKPQTEGEKEGKRRRAPGKVTSETML
jgi:hypothetical protein